MHKPTLPGPTRPTRGLRFLAGLGIVVLGSVRLCQLTWPLVAEVLSSALQRLA